MSAEIEEWYDLLREKAASLSKIDNSASGAFLEFELAGLQKIVRKITKIAQDQTPRTHDYE